ncbi:TonB-dependent receptor plug domain-containing protein [Riemerella columbina]|uniref:TonB-dependent receptor plug domain-containing protein n=1 Tax=Riemerella columbina TaxID=103810 RepID=UPI00266F507A|nr:TonB-dependent receptor [Riemerella columbina]WKS96105.1 TonB-dependent receptor [Riemerella columbina]
MWTTAVVLFLSANEVYGQQTPKKDSLKTKTVEEVVLLGSRGTGRSKTDSPVPVDVFDVQKMAISLPQTNLNQMLNTIAPSFTSTVQTNADGTDHLDPAQLRGLGPNQVLVLINGKRRHTSALVNVNGTPGRGTVGTDLNAIPSFAISKIEVLRDGAAAQYGSDAIAGVMNLNLKRNTGKLAGQVSYGLNPSQASNDHTGGTDGQSVQVDLNYGNKIGARGGFYNFTWSSQFRNPTFRASEEGGKIFNAYNAIEKRALENGVNLSELFSNINTTTHGQELVDYIHQYANQVGYFSADFKNQIQSANSIAALQGLLNADYTDQELAYRGLTRRDFNMQVGQSKLSSHQFFANIEVPISDQWKVYTFGGYSYRDGTSAGFYRRPNQARTFTGLHINGFLPNINTHITDLSLSAGTKGNIGDWHIDLSNTFGRNSFDYIIKNTGNTSLRFQSPNEFNAGGLQFSQNTLNLDISKAYDVWGGLNLAFGAEQRTENFKISAGEPASYLAYDVFGQVQTATSTNPTDFFGASLPGGSQVFAGYRPSNTVDKNRYSYAAYADVEANLSPRVLVDAAARFEHYSDFGSTFTYKLASRIKATEHLNFRVAGSTGFRAPSIHQIYYNATSTLYSNGELFEVGTFSNDSKIAELLGIPKLKQETSQSVSAGFTFKIPTWRLTLTGDAYFTKIKNRIVLTDTFKPGNNATLIQLFREANVNQAQFFANAIDTETKGLDIVITHDYKSGDWRLSNSFALNLNQTRRVGDIHSSEILKNAGQESNYFSERSRVYTEEAIPRIKAGLSHNLSWKQFSLYLRNSYFGKVTGADNIDVNNDGIKEYNEHQIMADKIVTDLSIGYQFTPAITLTVGANNLFDIYPSKNLPASANNGQFVYTRSTSQFGLNGRYLFSRLNFSF